MTFRTEKEAKNSVCPESLPRTALGSNCLGSSCMAWRMSWEHRDAPHDMKPAGDGWVPDGAPKGAGGAVTHRQKWKRPVFYCGKAGMPS